MNLVLIFAIGIVILSSILLMDVYASTHNRSHPSLVEVSLQVLVRDSEGRLVAYFEPNLMYIVNIENIHKRLDEAEDKEKILINGVEHELIVIHQHGHFTENHRSQIASFNMFYQGETVLAYRHDGYLTEPGYNWIAHWKIIRTIS